MDKRKNQHYVPQFLLRGWTDNERLPIYNLNNRQEYPETSISKLCSEDYFYGSSEAEKSMDGIEDRHARIIRNLRDHTSIKELTDRDIQFFCIFVLLQRNRTKQQKKETEKLIDNISKEYLQMQVESGEADIELPDGTDDVEDLLEGFRITHERPLAYPMLYALTGIELIIDLEIVIIENRSGEEFILSDHPVAHDNRRFKDEIDRYLVGVQNQGLQMFIPISDRVQIMLYDPDCYKVDYSSKEDRRVITSSEKVVTGLNDLQMINAFENIFYRERGQEQKFQKAQQRLSDQINEGKTIFNKSGPEEHDFDTDNEIIEFGQNLHDYSPVLPFVKTRMDAEFAIRRRLRVSQQHQKYLDKILDTARQKNNESS